MNADTTKQPDTIGLIRLTTAGDTSQTEGRQTARTIASNPMRDPHMADLRCKPRR